MQIKDSNMSYKNINWTEERERKEMKRILEDDILSIWSSHFYMRAKGLGAIDFKPILAFHISFEDSR